MLISSSRILNQERFKVLLDDNLIPKILTRGELESLIKTSFKFTSV